MLDFKAAQEDLAMELGFDNCQDTFIKGEKNIVMLIDIGGLCEINDEVIAKD